MSGSSERDRRVDALRELFQMRVLSSEELRTELAAEPERDKVVGITRLYWACEQGFDDGDSSVGPAWIDRLDSDGGLVRSERVAGGKWITRTEALSLAR